jgi:hypothetical protein
MKSQFMKLAAMGTSALSMLGEAAEAAIEPIRQGFDLALPRRCRHFSPAMGRYVLHSVSDDGKSAVYRHPTKKGPGRRVEVEQ